ncbi:hypothetical protein [Desulfobacula sp.]|uniref:HEPN AbiU2-like domain-containing protein n=1 Tax=Candidatus Desulfatibia vada TaxID=2841696 RepID=A0A8J6NXR5_9BACT|nr:hypothetical protein [Candidatus Desulfatibia vada]MBL6996468.1 hypothetical protein [Desulfobacula sp.]
MTIAELIKIQDLIVKEIATNNRFKDFLMFFTKDEADDNRALDLIQYNSTISIIINLVKLLNPNETFSFNRIFKMNPLNDSSIKKEINSQVLRDLRSELRTIQRQYKELEIENIRNQYIAHLDESGIEYRLDSIQQNRIVNYTTSFFDKLLFSFFNSKFEYDKYDDDIIELIKREPTVTELYAFLKDRPKPS